ncbi:MAG: T9SS type A sorting domain-containing protein [candidate division WOR-3 bacterium]
MKRLSLSVCLICALIGLARASGPDDNSKGGPYHPFNISYKNKSVLLSQDVSYRVYSVDGKLVLSGYGRTISLKALKPGMYIIKASGYAPQTIFSK